MTVSDLLARLRARLPPEVPVLPPQDALVPAEYSQADVQGRPLEGGESGLHLYLREQAPQGYVQLYDFQPAMTTSGIYDEHWATVDAIAVTEADASALAQQVRSLIGGTPRTGGNVRLMTPPRTERHGTSVRVSLQFSVRSAHPR